MRNPYNNARPIIPSAYQRPIAEVADIEDANDGCPICHAPASEACSTRSREEIALLGRDYREFECRPHPERIRNAGVLNPPLPPETDAISQAFSKARDTIAELEAKRVEHVGGDWSPSQHVRAA